MSLKNILYFLFLIANSFVSMNGSDEEKGSETTSLVNNESKHQHNEWVNKVYEFYILVGELSYSIAGVIFTIMEGEEGIKEVKYTGKILNNCYKQNNYDDSACQEEQKEYIRAQSCGPLKFRFMIIFYSYISLYALFCLFRNITEGYFKFFKQKFLKNIEIISIIIAVSFVILSTVLYFLSYTCYFNEALKYSILVTFLCIGRFYRIIT